MVSTPAPVHDNGQFAPGTMLGKYELLATIGTGGMANVILARQRGPAGFEKVVVIKVVHPHMAQDKAAVEMLHDEARVAAQISHPNVVQTYELGEANGTFYIVMEYLAGESFNSLLRKTVRSGELDPNIAAWIVAQAAEGLHAAHELKDFHGNSLGIVHRDVSPGNIVVLYNGTVKVVDFGIAKAHGRVTSTQDGQLKGKYGYMPPEQIQNEPLDRRADVFSLGVVLWEALALKRLFQADNVGATLMQVLSAKRVAPSEHRPNIPRGLDEIALRSLAVDPNARFQSAAEMKQAIEDVIWQSRCGAATVESYMTSLFSDRIEQRRTLLSRAARASLTQNDLEVLGAAFKENSPTAKSNASVVLDRPALPKQGRSRWPIVAVVAIAAGIAGGVLFLKNQDEPAPAAAPIAAPIATAPIVLPATPEPMPAPAPVVPTPAPVEATQPVVPTPAQPAVTPVEVAQPTKKRKATATAPPTTTTTTSKLSVADLYKQGTAAYIAGNFVAAQTAFKAAIAMDRSYAPAHRGLGFLYQRFGERANAIKSLKRYLELSPGAKDADAVRARIEQIGG